MKASRVIWEKKIKARARQYLQVFRAYGYIKRIWGDHDEGTVRVRKMGLSVIKKIQNTWERLVCMFFPCDILALWSLKKYGDDEKCIWKDVWISKQIITHTAWQRRADGEIQVKRESSHFLSSMLLKGESERIMMMLVMMMTTTTMGDRLVKYVLSYIDFKVKLHVGWESLFLKEK